MSGQMKMLCLHLASQSKKQFSDKKWSILCNNGVLLYSDGKSMKNYGILICIMFTYCCVGVSFAAYFQF